MKIADTFHGEVTRRALQWAIVYDRAQEVEGEDVRSQGLFDRLFLSFYRADIKAGRETPESAKRLVSDWFTRFWSQRHPERYADLQVRVCGWNVLWNDLSKAEQMHFLATAEAQE